MTPTPTPRPRPVATDSTDPFGDAPTTRTLADRARTNPEQLLLDLSGIWLDRYNRAQSMPRGNVFDPADMTDDLWRATASALCDAWTALYLLGLLRTHAPHVAEQAATFLNSGAPGLPTERLPHYVREWADAVAAGRSLLPLLP
jgi:hypothetical protein